MKSHFGLIVLACLTASCSVRAPKLDYDDASTLVHICPDGEKVMRGPDGKLFIYGFYGDTHLPSDATVDSICR